MIIFVFYFLKKDCRLLGEGYERLFGVVVVTGVRHRSRVTALFVFSIFPRKDFPNRMSFSRNHLMEWIKRRLTVRVVSVRVCVSPIGPEVFNSFVIHKRKRKKNKLPGSRAE
jgi:hypothetical protein